MRNWWQAVSRKVGEWLRKDRVNGRVVSMYAARGVRADSCADSAAISFQSIGLVSGGVLLGFLIALALSAICVRRGLRSGPRARPPTDLSDHELRVREHLARCAERRAAQIHLLRETARARQALFFWFLARYAAVVFALSFLVPLLHALVWTDTAEIPVAAETGGPLFNTMLSSLLKQYGWVFAPVQTTLNVAGAAVLVLVVLLRPASAFVLVALAGGVMAPGKIAAALGVHTVLVAAWAGTYAVVHALLVSWSIAHLRVRDPLETAGAEGLLEWQPLPGMPDCHALLNFVLIPLVCAITTLAAPLTFFVGF